MCAPLAAVAMGVGLASTAVSTIGKISQANYSARINDRNAEMARQATNDALDRGKRDQLVHGRKLALLRGSQTAAMAANGIDTSFGSAVDVAQDTTMLAAEDAQILRDNTLQESKGYSIQAANYRAQASAARSSRFGIAVEGFGDMFSTIAGGAKQGQFSITGNGAVPGSDSASRRSSAT